MKKIKKCFSKAHKMRVTGGVNMIFILLFVTALMGCTRKDASDGITMTVEDIPVFEENEVEVQTGVISLEEEKSDLLQEPVKEEKLICIHICGAVKNPGVYELKNGSRVYEAVCAAGGYADNADMDYVNQALVLNDSDKLVIPTLEETSFVDGNTTVVKEKDFGIEGGNIDGSMTLNQSGADFGKVNLNTATVEELCTLSGIGEARAKAIISYRTDNGPFITIEDIMNVSGIKEASFSKIKDDICVN